MHRSNKSEKLWLRGDSSLPESQPIVIRRLQALGFSCCLSSETALCTLRARICIMADTKFFCYGATGKEALEKEIQHCVRNDANDSQNREPLCGLG